MMFKNKPLEMTFDSGVAVLGLAGASFGVVLMLVRASDAISFSVPLQALTAGAEYETLFVVWKYIYGQAVYADHNRIPFAGTFYNWLFYAGYGEATALVLAALNLSDEWLPTVTRSITFAFLVYGTWITYRLLADIAWAGNKTGRWWAASFSLLIYFGPLMGYFGIATQPDAAAIAFEATALYGFFRLYPRYRTIAVLVFSGCAYVAWSFKQLFVFGVGAIGLYLLVRRDWKALAALTLVMVSAWAASLLIGGTQYRSTMLRFGGATIALLPALAARNFFNVAAKSIPAVTGLGAVVFVAWHSSNLRRALLKRPIQADASRTYDLGVTAVFGAIIAGALGCITAAKIGSGENQLFPLIFYITVALNAALAIGIRTPAAKTALRAAVAIGWLGQIAAIAAVLSGWVGATSLRTFHQSIDQTVPCLRAQPMRNPAYIGSSFYALPWMIPSDPAFVVHTAYPWDRARGIPAEHGGIEGLIRDGYFATLALSDSQVIDDRFNGAPLTRYRRRSDVKCKGWIFFDRADPVSGETSTSRP